MEAPPSKVQWKSLVNKHGDDCWLKRIKSRSSLYSSLEYLNADVNNHWLPQHSGVARDIASNHIQLKLVTAIYILQVNRSVFNQSEIDPICLMCKEEPETVDHFLIRCSALCDVRQPLLDSILKCAGSY